MFNIGDKVLCIDDTNYTGYNEPKKFIKIGNIYTIRDIENDIFFDELCFRLDEIRLPKHPNYSYESALSSKRFKKIDYKKDGLKNKKKVVIKQDL